MNDNYYAYVILDLTYDLKVEMANNDVHIFWNVLLKPIGDLSIIVHATETLGNNQAIMSHIDY